MRSLPLLLALCGSTLAGPIMTCNDNGTQRKNGDEWTSANGFVKKCISSEYNAQTKITACVFDKGVKVPVGSSVVETTSNGFVKKCSAPSALGYDTSITACVTSKQTKVPVGSSVNEDGMKFSCNKNADGSVSKSAAPLPQTQPISPVPGGDASANCGVQDGVARKNGEEWTTANGFLKKCTTFANGGFTTQSVACISPKGAKVFVGSSVVEDNMKFSCTQDGNSVKKSLEPLASSNPAGSGKCPNIDGKDRANGEEWKSANGFAKKCIVVENSFQATITGCVSPKGVTVAVGSSANEDFFKFSCKKNADGSVSKSTEPLTPANGGGPYKCKVDGGEKSEGEEWTTTSGFVKKCTQGYPATIACVSGEGAKVAIGSSKVEGYYRFECKQLASGSISKSFEPLFDCYPNYKIGDTWSSNKNFQFVCKKDGPEFANCLADDGKTKVPIGTPVTVGTTKFTCIKTPSGSFQIQRATAPSA